MYHMRKGYTVEKRWIASTGRNIKILIFRPDNMAEKVPGVLWLHGGGYATGMAEMAYMTRAIDLVKKHGAVVVSPAYRLSGKAPYPAALEDCYSALKYLKENAKELGVRDDQLMVGGESAGGGLTVALCLYARDKKEINIAYQMPLYPMIDDRDTESSRDNHAPVWNTKRNHSAWKMYLKNIKGEPPIYAAPARADDYTSLPAAYTFVGDIEPFYCETVAYIENLKKAGVEASIDVYKDCFHAFDIILPFSKKSKQAVRNFDEHFRYAVNHCFAKQYE